MDIHIQLASEKIGEILGWPISNTILTTWLVIIFLTIVSIFTSARLQKIPGRWQGLWEWIIGSLLKLVEGVLGDPKAARKYFPFVATFFVFIIASNWMGLFPGFGSLGWRILKQGEEKFIPLLRSANTDLNTTLALAAVSVLGTQLVGIAAIGFFKQIAKYLNFRNPILFFIGILEAIAEGAKMMSFSFRLFGNIFAGEVLLTVMAALVPFIAPLPFYGLELFVGFIQALVFMMLTLVFIKIAITVEH